MAEFDPISYLRPKKSTGKADSDNEQASTDPRVVIFRYIINKYSNAIENGEAKSVQEIKDLVQPDNSTIQKLKNEFISNIKGYTYQEHFLDAAKKAFVYVRKIEEVESPVKFWLKPEEIIQLKVADTTDKAIFLCSLLIALDNKDTKVLVTEIEDGKNRAVVLCRYGKEGRFWLLDPHNECEFDSFHGSMEWVIANYEHDGKKIVRRMYEFNNNEYSSPEGAEA